VIRLADRADAIAVAIRDAGPSDLILVAGKGHEDYQEISGVRHHFDDRAEARSALSVRAGTTSAVVIGGGVSGIAAARLAASRGMKVAISDRTDMDPALKSQLEAAGISCFDGGHSSNHLDGAELVLLSPGVRADHPLLLEAKKRLLPVRSEIDFALQGFSGRLIGVTGTNGKSTTVSMLGHLLGKLAIPVSVGGNIGDPPSDMVMRGELKSNVVLELSSYQLEQSRTLRSDVAIFSSFSHDHLERHGSVQAYFQAKWRLFDGIKPGGLCLMTADVAEVAEKFNLRIPAYSHQIVIPGIRSASTAEINSRLAILAAKHLESQFEEEELLATLADFRGLPYRCERIGQIEGHSVINDSKSTNCESTCAALAGIATGTQIILMMGGKGKGESYRDILASKDKINLLICFGASGQIIADELSSVMKTKVFPGMREAVAFAAKSARSAGCGLLFSPGCASFDEFRNFEHRGQEFNHAVYQWLDSSPDQRNGN
jgi:UDP-N-acetylmuramoylalanine--D-glutamate ligase